MWLKKIISLKDTKHAIDVYFLIIIINPGTSIVRY